MVPPLPLLLVMVLLAAGLLSGCVDTEEQEQVPEEDVYVLPAASRSILWPDCHCFEPSLAVGPDGTLYATRGSGTQILIQSPGAEPVIRTAPMPPWSGTATGMPGDSLVQTDAEGRLYYHTLLYQGGVFGPLVLLGVHIAISDDGGETWRVNRFLGAPDDATAPQLGADRQWLLVAPDASLHFVYQRHPGPSYQYVSQQPRTQDAAVMHASSPDGGETWSAFAPISIPGHIFINGQPAITSDGRLVVPYFAYGATRALHVAISDDAGRTFRSAEVWTSPDGPGALFPSLVPTSDGTLVLAWKGPDGALHVAASTDGGETWADPVHWSAANTVATSPWAVPYQDRLHVLWYRLEPEGGARLYLTSAPVSDLAHPVDHAIETGNATPPAQNTEFAYGILDGDALLYTVRSDPDARQLLLYTQVLRPTTGPTDSD